MELKGDDSHRVHVRRPFQEDPDFGAASLDCDPPEPLARTEEPR